LLDVETDVERNTPVRKSNHLLETKTNKDGNEVLKPKLYDARGFYYDGHGLYLQVQEEGQRSWSYRYKQTWRSLGSANVISVDEARATAEKLWKAARRGEDAIALLDNMRATAVGSHTGVSGVSGKTFGEALALYLAAKNSNFSDSNRKRELRRYEFIFNEGLPWFVALPIKAIDQDAKNKAIATFQNKARKDCKLYINAVIRYDETGELKGMKTAAVEHHKPMP